MHSHDHGWLPSFSLADRQGGATLALFGQTAGPSLIKVSTRWSPGRRHTRALRPNGWTQLDQIWHAGGREGGREGREGRGGEGREGGRGREGRGGEGRGGEGRGGQGRAGQGRAGEGRGGEGTVHTFHKPEPLWPRSLAGHPRSGWPASHHNH